MKALSRSVHFIYTTIDKIYDRINIINFVYTELHTRFAPVKTHSVDMICKLFSKTTISIGPFAPAAIFSNRMLFQQLNNKVRFVIA